MKNKYDQVCKELSKKATLSYSTSFSLGIRMFSSELRDPIFSIYGFVRFADEIVDSFHQYDKEKLLQEFIDDTHRAIENEISLNPILHAFQQVVHDYSIPLDLIDAFFHSMEMDLTIRKYSEEEYKKYIYGSAEVVGLMCLKVFTYDCPERYYELKYSAKKLGSAFQKVNFLRDIKSDYQDRYREYFPNVDYDSFSESEKLDIIHNIEREFAEAKDGIKKLPSSSRMGVSLAQVYYENLLYKLKESSVNTIKSKRIRIPNYRKYFILLRKITNMRFFQFK